MEDRNIICEGAEFEARSKTDSQRLPSIVFWEVTHIDDSKRPFGRMKVFLKSVVQLRKTDEASDRERGLQLDRCALVARHGLC
jgi:hypothetical protein